MNTQDRPDIHGYFGDYGGRFVPETLMAALDELEHAYDEARADKAFQDQFQHLCREYIGRPTPLYHAQQLSKHAGGAVILLKREDLAHTGAHKINNAVGQALLDLLKPKLSISGKSIVWEVNEQGVLPPSEIDPSSFGFSKSSISEIKGGTPEENASILRRIFSGEKGPERDVVVLNAAAAIYAGGRASGLKEGVRLAEDAIDSNQATEKLEGLIRLSNKAG